MVVLKVIPSKPVINTGARTNTAGRTLTGLRITTDGANVTPKVTLEIMKREVLKQGGMPLNRKICDTSIPLRSPQEIPIHAGCPSVASAAYRVKI